MDQLIEEFVHRQNLKRFRTLLAETKDEPQRQLASKLLAGEQSARCSSTDILGLPWFPPVAMRQHVRSASRL
jgi:hypothetical protein